MKQIVLLNVKPSYTFCSMMHFFFVGSTPLKEVPVFQCSEGVLSPFLSARRLLDPTEVGVKPWICRMLHYAWSRHDFHWGLLSVLGLTGETGSDIKFLILPSFGDQEVCYKRVKWRGLRYIWNDTSKKQPSMPAAGHLFVVPTVAAGLTFIW